MNYEKYLPIGTVVMLKGGSKRMMITGFCCISNEEPNKTYDYTGCLYPEGFISSNQTLLFDHSQIDRIDYMGFNDAEEREFKEKLNKIVNYSNSNNQQNTVEFNKIKSNSQSEYNKDDTIEFDIEEINKNSVNFNN